MGSIPLLAQTIRPPADPLDEFSRAAQLQGMIQQQQTQRQVQQSNAIGIQQQQQALVNEKAVTAAMTQAQSPDDIVPLILKNHGDGQTALKVKNSILEQKKNLLGYNDAQFMNEQKQADLMQGAHDAVNQAPDPQKPAIYQAQLAGLQKAGVDTSKLPPQFPGQQAFDQLGNLTRLHSSLLSEANTQREVAAKELTAKADQQKVNQENIQVLPELGVRVNKTTGETSPIGAGTMTTPAMMESKYVSLQQKLAEGQPLDPSDTAWVKAYTKMKALVPTTVLNLQAGLLSDQAKQMAAQSYAQTGALPAGMRSPAMSAGILNTAASTPGGAPNIAANKQAYAANTASLTSLQKNADQVAAFENTAGKNLDVFLNTAKKALDSGSPWINKPLRAIDAGGLGSADLAAYNAARVTAVTEIAKVLNSANASGVLSDSARNEVQGLIGPDATLKQVYSAANILRQDMANRHQAYQQQLSDIRGRTAGATSAPAPNSAPKFNVGDSVMYQGKSHKVTGVDPQTGKLTLAP